MYPKILLIAAITCLVLVASTYLFANGWHMVRMKQIQSESGAWKLARKYFVNSVRHTGQPLLIANLPTAQCKKAPELGEDDEHLTFVFVCTIETVCAAPMNFSVYVYRFGLVGNLGSSVSQWLVFNCPAQIFDTVKLGLPDNFQTGVE